jgi:hypothetical protein
VKGGIEGLLLRLGNVRLSRIPDPHAGQWPLSTATCPPELPALALQGRPIDFHAVLKVPRALLERYTVLPFALTGDTLLVATADPRNLFAHDDLRLATGLRIQWVETPRPKLEAVLQLVLKHLQ